MSRRIFLASLALALLFLALAWLTLGDYGITWDEPENFLSGELYLRFWRTGDRAWLDFEALKNAWAASDQRPLFYAYTFARQERYPPVANLVSACVAWLLNERLGWADPIVAHHAAIPLFGALGVLVAGLFAGQSRRRLLPALVAAATLALFPLYWNHAHNNVKDVPAAALFLATLWAAWRAFGRRPAVDWKWAAVAGVSWGLALGTKANALVIPPILLAWGAWLHLWPRWRGRPRIEVPNTRMGRDWHSCMRDAFVVGLNRAWLQAVAGLALLLVIGAAVLVAAWPYLWPDPLRRLWSVLRYFSSVGQGFPVYFEGQLYLAGQTVPWRYALTHLLLTTPLVTLALALVGLVPAIKAAWRGEDSAAALVLVALGATLLRASLPGMVIYNGLRQIMEVVPLLCILAGLGAEWLWDALGWRPFRFRATEVAATAAKSTFVDCETVGEGRLRSRCSGFNRRAPRLALGVALIAALLLPQLATLARLHPYEGAFFNALAGGMARAGESYAPEYWGQSYKDGAAWLNQHAGQGAWVAVPIAGHIARYSLRPDLHLVLTNQVAGLAAWTGEGYVMFMRDRDWYGGPATLPAYCEQYGVPVHVVRAGKAVILSIYRWPLTS